MKFVGIAMSMAVTLAVLPAQVRSDDTPFGYWSEAVIDDFEPFRALRQGHKSPQEWDAYAKEQLSKAEAISSKLEAFIKQWARGENNGQIPAGLLPPDLDNKKLGGWKVIDPNAIASNDQWWLRKAHGIDPKQLYFLFPDNHCTYAKAAFIAPFGTTLVFQGEFPYARFFDLQVNGPFDPKYPATVGFGAGEVPIVDADIEPLKGHANPFRVGANRNATRRGFEVRYRLLAGNAAKLNLSFKPPSYRGLGNERVGGPFRDGGPAVDGMLHPGIVWLRYYLPDRGKGPLAGVKLPKMWMQLPSGEKFWIVPKSLKLVSDRQNRTLVSRNIPGKHPAPAADQRWGWIKGFGIALTALEMNTRKPMVDKRPFAQRIGKRIIRDLDSRLFNRGPDQGAPGSYAVTATGCSYIHYLHRGLSIAPGHVAVITGKLPQTPRTRDGAQRMSGGQARYLSFTHYDSEYKGYPGILMGSVSDEDILTNPARRYCIVLSGQADKPSNSGVSNGVTWENWGDVGQQVLLCRWMSVEGDWEDNKITPNEANASWKKSSWSQLGYDETLLGRNKPGMMGEYHPVVHYMPKSQFESLGAKPLVELGKGVIWNTDATVK